MEQSVELMSLEDSEAVKYKYTNVFENPNKLPINQIHLEKSVLSLDLPKNLDITSLGDQEISKKYCNKATDILPALDKRWLPKCVLHPFEPYIFSLPPAENTTFVPKNRHFIRSLDYLLKCNYHQFWCTVLYEPTLAPCLRSFILNPIASFQAVYLSGDHLQLYKEIISRFILVYLRLITFKASESEYMSAEYGMKVLIDGKLLNLPIVITMALLYKNTHRDFVTKLTALYFDNTSQLDFQIKEMEELVKQTIMILDMVGGNICGFMDGAVIVPLSIGQRPAIFDLAWVYNIVNYLLYTITTINILFQFRKPAIEMALQQDLPVTLPYTYVNVYRELYEMLQNRQEVLDEPELAAQIYDEINLGRAEFIDLFHVFVSHCLDKALESMGDNKQQEVLVEVYLKLLTSALEEDYFICDYDVKYSVANQNEVFESCTPIDPTRTQFISTCLNKLPRHKRLEDLMKINTKTIEDIFRQHKKPEPEPEDLATNDIGPAEAASSSKQPSEREIDDLIQGIVDMFPHLGDGFVLQCLEAYDYNSMDVINAILEQNLPPHLDSIPFDSIRIPPEPEPEQPIIQYQGKRPEYNDALKLLNDKSDMREIKTYILEGVQYGNDNIYDDEYDDRDDEVDPVKVGDGRVNYEMATYNPNRDDLASDTSYSSEEEFDDKGQAVNGAIPKQQSNSKPNFCEDPALIRARREQRYQQQRRPQAAKTTALEKPKGQEDKNVQINRKKKDANKSTRANHSRRSGAQWKRSRGMIPS